MSDNNKPPHSPTDVAREAFKRLALRRIAPTPEAYRQIYEEITGVVTPMPELATSASAPPAEVLQPVQPAEPAMPETMPAKTKLSIPLVDDAPPPRSSLPSLVDEVASSVHSRESVAIPLVDDMPADVNPSQRFRAAAAGESPQLRVLRELLGRTLTLALGSLLQGAPALLEESEALSAAVRNARDEAALNDISLRLKQLCFKIELRSADAAEEHELLLRLLQLLLANVSELLEDDSWLSGQVAVVQNLLSGPITHNALLDATRSLKEVVYKQGLLKHSLTEAKVTVKNMMITFIDSLGAIAASTDDYHRKIDKYSQKISQARGMVELNVILDDVMRDTRAAQTDALRLRDQMVVAREEVQKAEGRIHELEAKLDQMSELVREDALTGSLNRRGLDDAFERELARSERRNTPLCVAMLDLDDFKRLNDNYGHSAGDEALIYLVRVVKDTLRTMDVVARFGGEEFLILLPETSLEDAAQTVARIQRELTKRIFMHNHERLLITFSAGVALRGPDEDQAALIKRADEALYKAKRAGKNRVVTAAPGR